MIISIKAIFTKKSEAQKAFNEMSEEKCETINLLTEENIESFIDEKRHKVVKSGIIKFGMIGLTVGLFLSFVILNVPGFDPSFTNAWYKALGITITISLACATSALLIFSIVREQYHSISEDDLDHGKAILVIKTEKNYLPNARNILLRNGAVVVNKN